MDRIEQSFAVTAMTGLIVLAVSLVWITAM